MVLDDFDHESFELRRHGVPREGADVDAGDGPVTGLPAPEGPAKGGDKLVLVGASCELPSDLSGELLGLGMLSREADHGSPAGHELQQLVVKCQRKPNVSIGGGRLAQLRERGV